uniref:Uncharacterized protein n=1 Tax=Anguilla anguilla TaxID=7936 RepID=A0A0E9PCR1_ANGAN
MYKKASKRSRVDSRCGICIWGLLLLTLYIRTKYYHKQKTTPE